MKTISVNIGSAKTRWAVLDENLNILDDGFWEMSLFHTEASKVIADAASEILKILEKWKDVKSCSIAIEGLNVHNNKVIQSPPYMLNFDGLDLKDEFNKLIKVEFYIFKEVNSIALGELALGNLSDVENAVIVDFGEIITGAIIINGKLYTGKNDRAANFGKLKLNNETFDNNQSLLSIKNKIFLSTGIEIESPRDLSKLADENQFVNELLIANRQHKITQMENIIEVLDPDVLLMCGRLYNHRNDQAITASDIVDSFGTEDYTISKEIWETQRVQVRYSKLKHLSSLYGMAFTFFENL